jgi:hypothetical protein
MDWIKRNLMFVVGGAVTLVLLGLAGWYSFSGYSHNVQERDKVTQAYAEMNALYSKNPAPGDGQKVNNIALAKEQQQEAREFVDKLAALLVRVPAIQDKTNVNGREFSAALQEAISMLQREATNASVILPPRYRFSFEKQASLVTFAPGTLDHLASQLGEVKVIAEILNAAKINSLESIRRERVPGSPDDLSGPATDYIDQASVTNEWAISTPYEVTFRSFSPELAKVLAGFAQSKYGLVVKSINVEPAATTDLMNEPFGAAPVYGQPVYQPIPQPAQRRTILAEEDRAGGRYAAPNRYQANPYSANPNPYGAAPQPAPVAVAPVARPTLQTILKERQLKVTLLVHVVKLLPPQP